MDTPTSTTTLRERVAALAVAADNAPSFGGLRKHLTEAAEFAASVVVDAEAHSQAISMLGLALQASAAALKQRDQRIEALESDFAAMLAKLDEIEQRLPAA